MNDGMDFLPFQILRRRTEAELPHHGCMVFDFIAASKTVPPIFDLGMGMAAGQGFQQCPLHWHEILGVFQIVGQAAQERIAFIFREFSCFLRRHKPIFLLVFLGGLITWRHGSSCLQHSGICALDNSVITILGSSSVGAASGGERL